MWGTQKTRALLLGTASRSKVPIGRRPYGSASDLWYSVPMATHALKKRLTLGIVALGVVVLGAFLWVARFEIEVWWDPAGALQGHWKQERVEVSEDGVIQKEPDPAVLAKYAPGDSEDLGFYENRLYLHMSVGSPQSPDKLLRQYRLKITSNSITIVELDTTIQFSLRQRELKMWRRIGNLTVTKVFTRGVREDLIHD